MDFQVGDIIHVSYYKANGVLHCSWETIVEDILLDCVVTISPAGGLIKDIKGDWATDSLFRFYEPGHLTDEELELLLIEKEPGNPKINYVPAYVFKMVCMGEDLQIGRIDLRIGNTYNLVMYGGHIGYRVEPEYRGHHYAARAFKLLMPLARRHGMRTLWITCNPENIAPRRTCELAGAEFVEIADLPEDNDMYQEGERQKCRYRLDL